MERGSFTDQWERRDELDPRDLVPVAGGGLSPKVVVYDQKEFNRIMGEVEMQREFVEVEVYKAA